MKAPLPEVTLRADKHAAGVSHRGIDFARWANPMMLMRFCKSVRENVECLSGVGLEVLCWDDRRWGGPCLGDLAQWPSREGGEALGVAGRPAAFQHLLNAEVETIYDPRGLDPLVVQADGVADYVEVAPAEASGDGGGWLGGLRTGLGLLSMVPGPIGIAGGLLEAGVAVAQGDWGGAAWAVAGAGAAVVGAGAAVKLARSGVLARAAFKGRSVGVASKLFGNKVTRTEGLLNKAGRSVKIGWSNTPNNGGGMVFRFGLGRNAVRPNASRFHLDVPGTFVQNQTANPIMRSY